MKETNKNNGVWQGRPGAFRWRWRWRHRGVSGAGGVRPGPHAGADGGARLLPGLLRAGVPRQEQEGRLLLRVRRRRAPGTLGDGAPGRRDHVLRAHRGRAEAAARADGAAAAAAAARARGDAAVPERRRLPAAGQGEEGGAVQGLRGPRHQGGEHHAAKVRLPGRHLFCHL